MRVREESSWEGARAESRVEEKKEWLNFEWLIKIFLFCIDTYTHLHAHTQMHTRIHTHIHTHIHTYIHTHIHTHIQPHIYTLATLSLVHTFSHIHEDLNLVPIVMGGFRTFCY